MKRGPLETVKFKTSTIPIYGESHHGQDRFLIIYSAAGGRKRERFKTLDAARTQAKVRAKELADGKAHVGTFTAAETATISSAIELVRGINGKLLPAVQEYVEAHKILGGHTRIVDAAWHYRAYMEEQKKKTALIPVTVPELVEKFMADIRERKMSRRYTLDMQARLARAAEAFTGQVADIKTDDVDLWLKSMAGLKGRTKRNYRAALGTLFKFARSKGYLPRSQPTEVEFSATYKDKGGAIGLYSPEQLNILLTSIQSRFVPFVAIAAFAGLRSAEIVRLAWEDVRWKHNDIELRSGKAKTASRRLVPILPPLRVWLEPFRKTRGPVLEGIRDEFALATYFKRAVDAIVDAEGNPLVKIVPNGFRHSFISNRLAVLKSAAAVALEAGNSPKMIFEHYRELRTEEEGTEWFSVMPEKACKVLQYAKIG